jgi:hypothetical protein
MPEDLLPIVWAGFYCDPDCPFLDDIGNVCARDGKAIDFYDWYIAHCIDKE